MTSPRHKDERLEALERWLPAVLGAGPFRVRPASEDASFRRYFRVERDGATWIAMDAPPAREDLGPYLQVAAMLAATGVHVPSVIERDLERGFLLLSDLGSRSYLAALRDGADADALYGDAIAALVRLQARGADMARRLPDYDRARLRAEMELFPEWFVARHLGLTLTAAERRMLDASFEALGDAALAQPQVLVHRDYHSRNLMVCPGANPGILDFQDAVRGAACYDLVSLLKDCYIAWPPARRLGWMREYLARASAAGVGTGTEQEFLRGFERVGLQRHIKVLGIFARLWYRDGKPGYLRDLPLVLDYAMEAVAGIPELEAFGSFLAERVVPAFVPAQRRAGAA